MDNLILEEERLDEIGFNQLKIIQKPKDFCYGVDAVILADFSKVKPGGRVIDLGTGTGIIPIILSHKTEAREIWGVEIQKESFERATRNVILNHLEDRVHIIHSDIQELKGFSDFDVVVSNPPYMKSNGGIKNENPAKTIARHETTATLRDFMKTANQLLKDKGDLYMVHRPSRLVDICCSSREFGLEPKEIRFVSPNKNSKPNIVLIHCVKGGNPELKFLDPLYVYEDGQYSEEIMKIYERDS